MIYDFHTHTCLSDGTLSPTELMRRAAVFGYRAIAITDHVGIGSLERVVSEVVQDCKIASQYWDIIAIPGIELTHIPPAAIASAAKKAKKAGAWLVVVHGETLTEPVEKGTNLAALQAPDVDILAHPGLLTSEEARIAATTEIFIELSARTGHCLANGHLVNLARETGFSLLLNSDAHDSADLLDPALASNIGLGAGLKEDDIHTILVTNPLALLQRIPLPG